MYVDKLTFVFPEYFPNAMAQAGTKAMYRMITFVAIMMEFFVCLKKTDGVILSYNQNMNILRTNNIVIEPIENITPTAAVLGTDCRGSVARSTAFL